MNEQEIWKPVTGFELYYEVSNTGKVKRLARSYESMFRTIYLSEKILSHKSNWYHKVWFRGDNGEMKGAFLAHRLIAEAFIPNPENKPFINHIDGNKANNHVKNLEWCTLQENLHHAKVNKLFPSGETHHNAKISDEDVLTIIERYNNGKYMKTIAKDYNVTRGLIHYIVKGKQRVYQTEGVDIRKPKDYSELKMNIIELEKEGKSLNEIADILGITYGQAAWHKHKYKKDLKSTLTS